MVFGKILKCILLNVNLFNFLKTANYIIQRYKAVFDYILILEFISFQDDIATTTAL